MNTVLDYLRANEDRFVRELCEYLRFPSVSAQATHKQDMEATAAWLAAHCRGIGLAAAVHSTPGHPIVIARTPRPARTPRGPRRPHFVVYGHYDVQPPEPLDLWKSPPFEPRIAGRKLFARGSSDNKGQHFAHLKAVEAFLRTGTPLPCDLTFLIEGEEEVGSSSLPALLRQRRSELLCDAFVISDTGIPDLRHPALTCTLRGIAALEVTVHGPSRDLHSGLFGGAVDNPAMILSRMLAALHDRRGRVAIPGLYDDVRPLSRADRAGLARVPHSDAQMRKLLGVRALKGESGFTTIERISSRPTLEINGLTSGYQGEGSKTIIPAWARAKLTLRLVPDQNPGRVFRLVSRHLKKLCPPTARLEIRGGHGGEPYFVSPDGPLAQACLGALEETFGCKPIILREGGSIPIISEFKKALGADSLLLGLALPDANAHSPNESFDLDAFALGMQMGAHLWPRLATAAGR